MCRDPHAREPRSDVRIATRVLRNAVHEEQVGSRFTNCRPAIDAELETVARPRDRDRVLLHGRSLRGARARRPGACQLGIFSLWPGLMRSGLSPMVSLFAS